MIGFPGIVVLHVRPMGLVLSKTRVQAIVTPTVERPMIPQSPLRQNRNEAKKQLKESLERLREKGVDVDALLPVATKLLWEWRESIGKMNPLTQHLHLVQ